MKLHELFEATTIRKWSAQVKKDHGDVKKQTTTDGRVIARNVDGDIVGMYNRKTGAAVVHHPLKEDLGKKNTIQLEKGLTHKEALKLAPWKKSYGDCRGFSYDAKTGVATWI